MESEKLFRSASKKRVAATLLVCRMHHAMRRLTDMEQALIKMSKADTERSDPGTTQN